MADDRRRIDRFLDPTYTADLGARSTEDLRLMKAECVEVETETSYLRRLAQGRIDIIQAEIDRRASGGSIGDLIDALPSILADGLRPSVTDGRVPQALVPDMSIEWNRGLEHLVGDDTLAKLPLLSEEELERSHGAIRAFEREVSEARKSLHDVISLIERELNGRLKEAFPHETDF